MALALDAPLRLLAHDYRTLAATGEPVVLATIIETAGSTYRKAGARMLITRSGEVYGLLSGGCLENDLAELARQVLETGAARRVSYDMRSPDDLVFGFGAGCEGAMEILLQRAGPEESWQPLEWLATRYDAGGGGTLATVTASADPALPLGATFWPGGTTCSTLEPVEIAAAREAAEGGGQARLVDLARAAGAAQLFISPIGSQPSLLLLGGGPDAMPIASLAVMLGFRVTVSDHRPANARAARFPGCTVHRTDADAIASELDLSGFDAAVVMSHYLPADEDYLRALAAVDRPAYVGLLGPTARRDRLLEALGASGERLAGRLRGPVGLDIGASTPEAIAISILAEVHAALAGADARPRSTVG